jgi:hypothetical protein
MQDEKKNVYGENHPEAEGENTRGIREKTAEDKDTSTADQMDSTRDQMQQDQPSTGGMGREGTPKDGPSQGQYQGVGEDEPGR